MCASLRDSRTWTSVTSPAPMKTDARRARLTHAESASAPPETKSEATRKTPKMPISQLTAMLFVRLSWYGLEASFSLIASIATRTPVVHRSPTSGMQVRNPVKPMRRRQSMHTA